MHSTTPIVTGVCRPPAGPKNTTAPPAGAVPMTGGAAAAAAAATAVPAGWAPAGPRKNRLGGRYSPMAGEPNEDAGRETTIIRTAAACTGPGAFPNFSCRMRSGTGVARAAVGRVVGVVAGKKIGAAAAPHGV